MSKSDLDNLKSTLIAMADERPEAFKVFYKTYYNDFIKFGRLISNDIQQIEDSIQNILIWAFENPKKLSQLQQPDVYFFKAMRNNLIKMKKNSSKQIDIDISENVKEFVVEKSSELKLIEHEEESIQNQKLQMEIEKLPDYLKQVLYLRYFSNLAYDDITNIMEIQPNVARIYVHRAIERLRSVIDNITFFMLSIYL